MKKYKPLNLMNNKGFWPEKVALVDAIKEVLTIGKCTSPPPIRDYGRYRDEEWRNEEEGLAPYRSVDWYVYDALDEDRMQVDSDRILESFASEPWRNEDMLGEHYDLFIMQEDMFSAPGDGEHGPREYVVGKAQRLTAAVVSTHRIEHIWGLPYSYLKTEVMRQLCFMFGVPDMRRSDVTVENDGHYCPNVCILRPAHVAPDDWQRLTEDRLRHGALCEGCTRDLRRFFQQVAREAARERS
jgi:hypothetical protein